MKKEKISFVERVVRRGICGVSTLIVGSGAVMMAPMTMADVTPNPVAGSATSDVVVNLTPTISLGVYSDSGLTTETDGVALKSGGSTTILPTVEGVSAEGSAYVGVATNDAGGYTLKMTMVTGEGSTALKPQSNETTTSIAAGSASGSDVAGLTKDTWGYRCVGTKCNSASVKNYMAPVLAANLSSAPTIYATSGPSASINTRDAVQVTFGAKVSTATMPDAYSNTVMFTALANSISGS